MDPSAPNFLTCPGVPELPLHVLSPSAGNLAPQRKRHRAVWIVGIGALFVLISVAVSPLVYGASIARPAATHLQATMDEVQERIKVQDFAGAEAQIALAKKDLQEIRRGVESIGPWRSVWMVRPYIAAFEEAELGGQQTLAGAEELLAAAQMIRDALAAGSQALTAPGVSPTKSFNMLSREEKRFLLAKLNDALPRMRLAREKLSIALATVRRIRTQDLYAPLQKTIQNAVVQFEDMYRGLDEGIRLAEVFLPMAGYPEAKSYLFLLQNSEEMRATGGFIGNVGYVHLDAGEMQDLSVQDVYSIDLPISGVWPDEPPAPLKRWLELKKWFLRDSNWSPDFPTSAQRIMDVYYRERAMASATTTAIDGVIALNPDFFRDLLRLSGPVEAEGKIFTADNFFDLMEWEVEVEFLKTGKPRAERKELIGKVGEALVQKLMSQPASEWPKMLDAVTAAFDRKDVLVYANDPEILRMLDDRGWSGRMLATLDDYLWVVDSNMAAWKTDGVMEKQIFYSVDTTAPGGPLATVRLRYRNPILKPDWRYTRYRDYVRVYVPRGSELLSASGMMDNDIERSRGNVLPGTVDVSEENGKTVFGAFWAIEPKETRELIFTYRLPIMIVNPQASSYRLLVQRQPGNHAQLTVDHLFGKKLMTAVPAESAEEYGDHRYRTTFKIEKNTIVETTF
ncbi:MAG: DUF4012 domain-containing protein [Patescibacteria group bacterium]